MVYLASSNILNLKTCNRMFKNGRAKIVYFQVPPKFPRLVRSHFSPKFYMGFLDFFYKNRFTFSNFILLSSYMSLLSTKHCYLYNPYSIGTTTGDFVLGQCLKIMFLVQFEMWLGVLVTCFGIELGMECRTSPRK